MFDNDVGRVPSRRRRKKKSGDEVMGNHSTGRLQAVAGGARVVWEGTSQSTSTFSAAGALRVEPRWRPSRQIGILMRCQARRHVPKHHLFHRRTLQSPSLPRTLSAWSFLVIRHRGHDRLRCARFPAWGVPEVCKATTQRIAEEVCPPSRIHRQASHGLASDRSETESTIRTETSSNRYLGPRPYAVA